MEIYFELVSDADAVRRACEELSLSEFLGFDTETTELSPFRGDLRLVQLSDGRKTKVFDMKPFRERGSLAENESLAPLRKLLAAESPRKIAHNAKFDARWVKHNLGIDVGGIVDTMLASQLIAAGDTDRRHSLADVSSYFLGVELDKTQQISDWSGELSRDQLEYAARDAVTMIALREKMTERLTHDGLVDVAELEYECVAPVAAMEQNGFFLDRTRWLNQLEGVKISQAKLSDELQDMLSAGVAQASLFGRAELNLDSHAQVADALRNIGVPVSVSTRASELLPLADEYPAVAKLLEYRGFAKSLSSFGENILEFIELKTGRIHSDFRQIGAPSGRFSCSNPNIQQIPHTEEYRRCFRAPDGRKLVVADYSQIELRILAEFSGDENFIRAFQSGADFHATAAAQVFNIKPEDVSAEQRTFAKRLNFGIVYGIGASRFASMTGLKQNDAENLMRRYFATYRKLDAWLRGASQKVLKERISRTASGRMVRHRFDENNREEIGNAQRYAKNIPIQGTSADILKRALRILHDEISQTSTKLVNIVHDEIIVETDETSAPEVAKILESSMLKAAEKYVKNVPVKVDVKISDEWTK